MFGLRERDACPKEVQRELEDLYTAMFQQAQAMPEREARRTVRQIIQTAIAKGRREGMSHCYGDYGNFILLDAKAGNSPAREIVDKAHRDGATDADIREWWSLYDVQRRMILFTEKVLRYSTFLSHTHQGVSADDAMAQVRKEFPMYGDPDDTRHVSGEDRPLPHEIRGRVDRYRNRQDPVSCRLQMERFNTFNACVRDEIRSGRL